MYVEQQLRRCGGCGQSFVVLCEYGDDHAATSDEDLRTVRPLRCPNPDCGLASDVPGLAGVKSVTVRPFPYPLPAPTVSDPDASRRAPRPGRAPLPPRSTFHR